jgi:hypothetical protein
MSRFFFVCALLYNTLLLTDAQTAVVIHPCRSFCGVEREMTNIGDRAVFAACLVAAGVLIVDIAGLTAERWAEFEAARKPQTVCGMYDGQRVCVDVGVWR